MNLLGGYSSDEDSAPDNDVTIKSNGQKRKIHFSMLPVNKKLVAPDLSVVEEEAPLKKQAAMDDFKGTGRSLLSSLPPPKNSGDSLGSGSMGGIRLDMGASKRSREVNIEAV